MVFFKKTLVLLFCILHHNQSTSNAFSLHHDKGIPMRQSSSPLQVFHTRTGGPSHHGFFSSTSPTRHYSETISNGASSSSKSKKRGNFSWPFQIGYNTSGTAGSNGGKLLMKKEDSTIPSLRSRRPYNDQENKNTPTTSSSAGSTSGNPSSKKDYSLSAASLFSDESIATSSFSYPSMDLVFDEFEKLLSRVLPNGKAIMPVISAALLITSNTVGASMMVLPGLAQGPGMIVSSGLIGAVYIINLVSGLLIAEVAINQYEASSCEVPSSFKEFADVNLQSSVAGNFVSSVSLFINTCVLSYDLVTAGRLTNQFITSNNDAVGTILGLDVMNMVSSNEHVGLFVAATFFVGLVSTQSGATLSLIASILCMMLFTCFAGMVLPGIAVIHDPLATFAAQGTSEFGSEVFMNDVATFVPVLLTAMVYQNIVPTITKMLKYDRAKTVQAIIFGSAIPMIMYIAFCFTVLGGGAVPGVGSGNMFLTGITASSVFGSAMACIISIAEELDVYFADNSSTECEVEEVTGIQQQSLKVSNDASEEKASFSSVSLGVLVPTLAGIFFADGDGFVKALSISGSYGSPLLYGVVPVVLAFSQRTAIMKEFEKDDGMLCKVRTVLNNVLQDDTDKGKQLAPGGMFGIGALAAGAATLMSTHAAEDVSSLIAASSHVLY